ncbi:MAG: hypothetical protein ACI9R3_002757 [Verrucomicrobiales bacterium]|jgi:hypothetical protein
MVGTLPSLGGQILGFSPKQHRLSQSAETSQDKQTKSLCLRVSLFSLIARRASSFPESSLSVVPNSSAAANFSPSASCDYHSWTKILKFLLPSAMALRSDATASPFLPCYACTSPNGAGIAPGKTENFVTAPSILQELAPPLRSQNRASKLV